MTGIVGRAAADDRLSRASSPASAICSAIAGQFRAKRRPGLPDRQHRRSREIEQQPHHRDAGAGGSDLLPSNPLSKTSSPSRFQLLRHRPQRRARLRTLKDWSERAPAGSAEDIGQPRQYEAFRPERRHGFCAVAAAHPVSARRTASPSACKIAAARTGGAAAGGRPDHGPGAAERMIVGVRPEGLPDAAQVLLSIDREKANTFGVTFADINNTITANLGSSYVNDFPMKAACSASSCRRARRAVSGEDLLKLNVRNASGGMVPLAAFADVKWQRAPPRSSAITLSVPFASRAWRRRAWPRARDREDAGTRQAVAGRLRL